MDQQILFEIKKFSQKKSPRRNHPTLPSSFLFSDRRKISDFEKTINSLPQDCAIVIREYDLEKKEREIFAKKIVKLARSKSLKILVGKDLELARKIRADGVHFSDRDLLPLQFRQRKRFKKNFVFSFACHDLKSVLHAQKIKTDLIFLSPIFPTTSHLQTKALGIKNLAKISFKTKSNFYFRPKLYALGGITPHNIASVRKLGLSGFAAISLFAQDL